MKTKIVRWTAVYETVINVPENSTPEKEATLININIPGSECQIDTLEVLNIKDPE